MRIHIRHLLPLFLLLISPVARAQYNQGAGANAPAAVMEDKVVHDAKTGLDRVEHIRHEAPRDSYGNAQGNQHDLAVDGAFDGQTIAVLHFYPFSFDNAKEALREK